MADHRIGSDRKTDIEAGGLGPTQYIPAPAGPRHAVPEGQDVALCGHRPRHVFDGTSWPGMPGRNGFACELCVEAARGS